MDLTTTSENDKAEPATVDSGRRGSSSTTSVGSSIDEADNITDSASIATGTSWSNTGMSFDDWLSNALACELEFPNEDFQEHLIQSSVASDSFTGSCWKGEADDDDFQVGYGRKSAADGKAAAFYTPIFEALQIIYQPCNNLCYLSGYCTRNIPGRVILDLRLDYFDEQHKDAPKDKARAEKIIELLRRARQDQHGNLIFNVEGSEVCLMAFLRLLGASTSVDKNKAPGQWLRLVKAFTERPEASDTLLNEKDLELDAGIAFTEKKGHAITFIMDVMTYYSETLATVTSDDGKTEAMQIPYSTVKDVFFEYEFHCHAFGIGRNERASYATFLRAWNELYKDGNGIVKLLGGKSGFQTCAICNSFLSIKRSACCKRDLITKECLQKLCRLHLLQQSTERQHAEFFIAESKKLQHARQPTRAYIDIDPQSSYAGNTPKLSKDRQSKENTVIENRNIGVHIVCGPVDEYISICTDNLIPKGANVLVEATKFAIEYLAKRLGDFDMILPRVIGLQFDNSGENKVNIILIILYYLLYLYL